MLGPEGMSSDEEIDDGPHTDGRMRKRYRRTRKVWISQQVVDLHAVVDERTEKWTRETLVRGSVPHLRVWGDPMAWSVNPMVIFGLPHNAYSEEYLDVLGDEDRERLAINPEPHPF